MVSDDINELGVFPVKLLTLTTNTNKLEQMTKLMFQEVH